MFKINLREKREALQHLIAVNTELIFANGTICALHKELFCFAMMEIPEVELEEPSINDCSVLVNILRSKTAKAINFDLEKQRLEEMGRLKFEPMIKAIGDNGSIEEALKRYDIINTIKTGEHQIYTDTRGVEHAICSFSSQNEIILDMIRHMGQTEALQVYVGKDGHLWMKNHTTDHVISDPVSKISGEASIIFNDKSAALLKSSLLQTNEDEEAKGTSTVYLVDGSYAVITNKIATLIQTRV